MPLVIIVIYFIARCVQPKTSSSNVLISRRTQSAQPASANSSHVKSQERSNRRASHLLDSVRPSNSRPGHYPGPDQGSSCSSGPCCSIDDPGPSCSLDVGSPDDPEPVFEQQHSRKCISGGPSDATSQEKLHAIAVILPDTPLQQVKFLLEVHHDDTNAVMNLLLEGLSIVSLLESLKSCFIDECSARKLVIDEYDNSARLAEEAIAFYKSNKFSPYAELRVTIENQIAVDAGGVRRQFMSDVFSYFTTSCSLRLFEGPQNRLRPCFRQSSISLLALVGKMVGHSIVQDGIGFPFLSPACYFYMAGYVDRAISAASIEDVGENVKQVVKKVSGMVLI